MRGLDGVCVRLHSLTIETGNIMRALVLAVVTSVGLMAGCASTDSAGGERPPEGKASAAGTDFGRWRRDAEGAVDAAFRGFMNDRYDASDVAKAQSDLTADGFECRDGNRPDGRPVPDLECFRLYELNDDIHAWTVEFWPDDSEPRARYTRTRIMDPLVRP